jgi:hypothetical protein
MVRLVGFEPTMENKSHPVKSGVHSARLCEQTQMKVALHHWEAYLQANLMVGGGGLEPPKMISRRVYSAK